MNKCWRMTGLVAMAIVTTAAGWVAGQSEELLTRSAAAVEAEPEAAEVARLIEQLGGQRFAEREAAEKRLVALGYFSLEALEKAASSEDPEVSMRAGRALAVLRKGTPDEAVALRGKARDALRAGDYDELLSICRRQVCLELRETEDILWLGRTHLLRGEWPQMVRAYEMAVDHIDDELARGRKVYIAAAEAVEGREMRWGEDFDRPFAAPAREARIERRPLEADEASTARADRAYILRTMGRVQREKLGDLKAAAETFARATAGEAFLQKDLKAMAAACETLVAEGKAHAGGGECGSNAPQLRPTLACLRELAEMLQRQGELAAAIDVLARVDLAERYFGLNRLPPLELNRLLMRLPADAALPELPQAIRLTAEQPSVTIDPEANRWKAFCLEAPGGAGWVQWRFWYQPPAGMEFATLELSADVDQEVLAKECVIVRGYVALAESACYLSQIFAAEKGALGRKRLVMTQEAPDGGGGMFLHIWQCVPGSIKELTVKATFRKRREPAAPAAGPARIVLDQPVGEGGSVRLDGEVQRGQVMMVDPGRHVVEVQSADGRKARCDGNFAKGREYVLHLDPANAFSPSPANLLPPQGHWPRYRSLGRLADGRWLLAWEEDRGILFSMSRDLVSWEEPWEFAENRIFRSQCPSLFVDAEGEVWMAFWSRRLEVNVVEQGSARLFLTHCGDGRSWSVPRHVWIDYRHHNVMGGGLDVFQASMVRSPDGTVLLLMRDKLGTGETMAGITEIVPLANLRDAENNDIGESCVGFDGKGRRVIFFRGSEGAAYKQVGDEKPRLVVDRESFSLSSELSLVVSGERLALLCRTNEGPALYRGMVDGDKLEKAVMVGGANDVTCGKVLTVTPEGKVVFLGGPNMVWKYEGDLEQVLGGEGK